jgi:hypothetical protein
MTAETVLAAKIIIIFLLICCLFLPAKAFKGIGSIFILFIICFVAFCTVGPVGPDPATEITKQKGIIAGLQAETTRQEEVIKDLKARIPNPDDSWSAAVQKYQDAQRRAEKELGTKGDYGPFNFDPSGAPPATLEQAKTALADYEAGTVAEAEAYIAGQSLPPYIQKFQQVDQMWRQVKWRVKRLAQLKVELGLPPEEEPRHITKEQLKKELDEASLRMDAIIAMNGGKLPANWPTNPPKDDQMSEDEMATLEQAAQRRIDAVRAAHGGKLPSNWRELLPQIESGSAATPASTPLTTGIYVGKRYSAFVFNSPMTVLIKGSVEAMADLPSVADSQIGDCWYIKAARTYMAVTTLTRSYEIALNLSETTN